MDINEACKLSRTRYLWMLDDRCDYSNFDFSWEPAPWESEQIHVWPSQHQENSGTMLVPKHGAVDKNYNHAIVNRVGYVPRLHIKHSPSSPDLGDINTRYISDYLGTMRRVLKKVDWEYCWVTADVCDYKDFDFTWHHSEYQHDMLHVFPSNEQKFGDTFYVHVPSFLAKTENLKILEWFETLHFVTDVWTVKRHPMTFVDFDADTVVDAVWQHEFVEPYAVFRRYDNAQIDVPAISLWQEQTKTVVPLVAGASTVLIPREAKNHLNTQIYDYPWVDKSHPVLSADPQDIVYISYDEIDAEKNYNTLLEITKDLPNTVHRVHGVKGMQQALQAASSKSNTPWSYHVFAKTELNPNFKFDYIPDYMQIPKNYIFNCKNMSNNLVYGHMGVVLYNNRMVIESADYSELGLDFTMSFPVEVVPELSCYGNFATSPYQAWRTAFRETSKLSYFLDGTPNMEARHRLHVWTNVAHGPHCEWVLNGARDGVEFFKATGPDLPKLKAAFDWTWLRQYFDSKYGSL